MAYVNKLFNSSTWVTNMHIGHNEDDIDHEGLALRHLGEGMVKERAGQLHEALNEYMVSSVLDPSLEVAKTKLKGLKQKLGIE